MSDPRAEGGMRILVDGIPATGREVLLDGARWATAAAAGSLERPPTTLTGVIHLKRAANRGAVVVDVRAHATADAVCDRCGEPCTLDVQVDTRLLYAPEEVGGAAYDGLDA